jgi:hypothetical protein
MGDWARDHRTLEPWDPRLHRADERRVVLERTGRSQRLRVAGVAPSSGRRAASPCTTRCAVYALNPKQLDRFRDRYGLAGAKDDRT